MSKSLASVSDYGDRKRSGAVCKPLDTSPCLGQPNKTSLQLDRFHLAVRENASYHKQRWPVVISHAKPIPFFANKRRFSNIPPGSAPDGEKKGGSTPYFSLFLNDPQMASLRTNQVEDITTTTQLLPFHNCSLLEFLTSSPYDHPPSTRFSDARTQASTRCDPNNFCDLICLEARCLQQLIL